MNGTENVEFQLVSPEGVLWEGPASFAVLPAHDGELGIYPGHAPLLARLGIGEARIHTSGGTRYFALFGGFLEVVQNKVQVIVERAESPETIDVEEANRELDRLKSLERRDYESHEEEISRRLRAQIRLRVAQRAP